MHLAKPMGFGWLIGLDFETGWAKPKDFRSRKLRATETHWLKVIEKLTGFGWLIGLEIGWGLDFRWGFLMDFETH